MDSRRSVLSVLLMLAAVVVVVAGLKAAQTLMLPFLFSVVLAILVFPVVAWLEAHRLPRALAILTSVVLVLAALVLVATITGQSMQEFGARLPEYQQALQSLYQDVLAWLVSQGLDPELLNLEDSFDPNVLMGVVGSTLNGVLDILSNTIMVTITMAFLLAEATAFPDKLRRAFPAGGAGLEAWRGLVVSVQRYLLLKTISSGVTGVLLGSLTAMVGLDSPVLWGFIAFVLNFIPTIGSIIAAIPAVLLALILLGPGVALITAAGYIAVNLVIGSVLEPRILGDRLGLSPLVVLLSLIFWGWVWGPAGMLLSVPLTVVLRRAMEHRPETRWLAVLLGQNQRP